MTREEEIARGKAAELLLRNELLAEAFETLESTYTAAWKSTAPGQASNGRRDVAGRCRGIGTKLGPAPRR
jgi:hypothetical protein